MFRINYVMLTLTTIIMNFLIIFFFSKNIYLNWIFFTWSFSCWNLGSVKALQTSSLWKKKLFLKPFFMKPRLFIHFIRFGRKIEYKISSCNNMSGGRKKLQKGKRGINTPTPSLKDTHMKIWLVFIHIRLFSILHEFVNIKLHVPWF